MTNPLRPAALSEAQSTIRQNAGARPASTDHDQLMTNFDVKHQRYCRVPSSLHCHERTLILSTLERRVTTKLPVSNRPRQRQTKGSRVPYHRLSILSGTPNGQTVEGSSRGPGRAQR